MHNTYRNKNRPLKTLMMEHARTKNGEMITTAALAVVKELDMARDESSGHVNTAILASLVRPVAVSMYRDLSESRIDMLANNNTLEMIVAGQSSRRAAFDPWAIKYNPGALMALLIPLVQPVITRDPTTIILAAAGLIAGFAALGGQWRQMVTGDDAELIVMLKHSSTFSNNATMSEALLLQEVNNTRVARSSAQMSIGEFNASIQRLIAYKFIDYDSAEKTVTLNS